MASPSCEDVPRERRQDPLSHPLSEAMEGSLVQVENLPHHPALRERLLAMGIRPGVQLEVLRRGTPGGILHLAHGLLEFMLRRDHAHEIGVTPGQESRPTPSHPQSRIGD